MRKVILFLLIVVFLTGCEFLTSTPSDKKLVSIEVDSTTLAGEVEVHQFNLEDIHLVLTFDDASTEHESLTEDMISSLDLATLSEPGTHDITVNYQALVVTFTITLYDINDTHYVVQFVDYDGYTLKVETVDYGLSATPPSNPSRDGYTFTGWDKSYSNITQEEIITALYQIRSYTVRFIDYDGSTIKVQTVDYGNSATAPSTPIRDGYTFVTWDKDFSVINHNTTINAVYRDNNNINLQRYTIKIAESASEISQVDPFHSLYRKNDKIAKQKAWTWVEQNYNCQIEVVGYPSSAQWGTPRWNYILNQAMNNTSDYDFYKVPDSKIKMFVLGHALVDLTTWYEAYGDGFMDDIYVQSGTFDGKLYSITGKKREIHNVMYYNIGLLSKLGLEKTPAQLFNEGDWTYSTFQNYAIMAQTALNQLPNAQTRQYYAVAGCSPYYWIGMTHAGGVKIADVSTLTFQPYTSTSLAAAATLRSIHSAGAMDPLKQVDAGVISWNEGRALFTTGDVWFVNEANHWRSDLWTPGNPDATRYGYVPFPRPDGTTKDEQRIGIPGCDTWVMARGRDYSGYGPECTTENIYQAMAKTIQLTKEYYIGAPG
ncbi:MAG: InlB B-repeat-containing protein, partial [Bacilli bacterium]